MKLGDQPTNTLTYVCQHVFEASRSVDYVHYDKDGELLMTCCGNDHDFTDPSNVRVVGLGHLLTRDRTLLELPDLHRGAWAERSSPNHSWEVRDNAGKAGGNRE